METLRINDFVKIGSVAGRISNIYVYGKFLSVKLIGLADINTGEYIDDYSGAEYDMNECTLLNETEMEKLLSIYEKNDRAINHDGIVWTYQPISDYWDR